MTEPNTGGQFERKLCEQSGRTLIESHCKHVVLSCWAMLSSETYWSRSRNTLKCSERVKVNAVDKRDFGQSCTLLLASQTGSSQTASIRMAKRVDVDRNQPSEFCERQMVDVKKFL